MGLQKIIFQSLFWRGFYFASQLLLNILIARYYEPSGSGWLFYSLNNFAFFILIISLSIDSGLGYFLAGKKIHPLKLWSLSLAWVLAAGLITMIIAKAGESPPFDLVLALGFIPGSLLLSFFSAMFFAQKDFIIPNLVLVVINILLVFMLPPFAFFAGIHLEPYTFIIIYCYSFLLAGLVLALLFYLRLPDKNIIFPSNPELKKLLGYSVIAFAGNMLTFLVFRVDYWMIRYFDRTFDELGNYIQVSKLAQLFFSIPAVIATAVFPFAASTNIALGPDLKILSRSIGFVTLIACIFLAFTGQWLFPLVFGNKFDDMYMPFLLISPGIIAISMAYPLAGYFSGKNLVMVNVFSSIFALLIILIVNIIFIPQYGIRAAAAASGLGYTALFIYLLYKYRKQEQGPLLDFLVPRWSDIGWFKQVRSRKKNS